MANVARKTSAATEDNGTVLASDTAPVWLTIWEVAERLRVSRRTAYRLVTEGKLKAANFGSQQRPLFRVDEDEFERYVREAQEGPAEGR
jgi:excisionase family DNA binding protein